VFDEKSTPNQAGLLDALVKAGLRGVAPPASEGKDTLLETLMATSQRDLWPRGLLLAGLWKQERSRSLLEDVIQGRQKNTEVVAPLSQASPSELGTLKAAAVQGLVKLGGEASKAFLVTICTQHGDASTRALALAGLSDLAPNLAAKQAVEFLAATRSAEEAKPVIEAFLKNKKLPAILAKELEGKSIPEAAAIEGIRLASSKGMATLIEDSLRKAGNIKQMDKPLPAEEMTAMVAKVAKLGDPVRGERVYRRQQLLCMTCHAIAGVGGVIGPDMVSLGASAQIDYLIESIPTPPRRSRKAITRRW
jgi:hypothetical protein